MYNFIRQKSASVNLYEQKWSWPYIGIVILYAVIALVSSNPVATLSASISFASFFILVGIGQMLVITTGPGNIDLSIPYTIALAGLVAMKIMNEANGLIVIWGVGAGILVGACVGCANYGLIRLAFIPPMLATLACSYIIRTLSIVFFGGRQIKPPSMLERLVNTKAGFLPVMFLFIIVLAVIMHFILSRTKYGRNIHAIGQNIKAAWLSGVHVNRAKCITYTLSGAFAGLTGVLLAAFSGGANLGMGNEYMMNSIAVVVLGGSSIAGGNSNVAGIVGASVFLYLTVNLMNILGLGVNCRYIFTGLIIVGIIFAGGSERRR